MSEKVSEKSENTSENSENRGCVMSALIEAGGIVRKLAEPRPVGDSVKAAIRRSARRLRGWSISRVKDVWYGDKRICISGDELNELRRAARQQEEAKARDEYAELVERLAALTAGVGAIGAHSHRPNPDQHRNGAVPDGGPGSALDRQEDGGLNVDA